MSIIGRKKELLERKIGEIKENRPIPMGKTSKMLVASSYIYSN